MMFTKIKLSLGGLAAVLALSSVYPAPPANAETDPSQSFIFGTSGQNQISDTQLKSFIEAEAQVKGIRKAYQEKQNGAGTQAERDALIAAMNTEIVNAIQNANLSLEQYQEIEEALKEDSELKKRYSQMI